MGLNIQKAILEGLHEEEKTSLSKITKKDFVNYLDGKKSLYLGVTKTLVPEAKLQSIIDDMDSKKDTIAKSLRTATAKPTYITFSDGSRTMLNDNGKHTYFSLSYKNYTVVAKKTVLESVLDSIVTIVWYVVNDEW